MIFKPKDACCPKKRLMDLRQHNFLENHVSVANIKIEMLLA